MNDPASSTATMAAANLVMAEASLAPRTISTSGQRSMVIGANAEFAVGVIEFAGPEDLVDAEHDGLETLVNPETFEYPKKWDTYLVLISAARPDDGGLSESTFSIIYDTRNVRRLVKWGIGPSRESVAGALIAFTPLPTQGTGARTDPFDDLEAALIRNGIHPDRSHAAIQIWMAQ